VAVAAAAAAAAAAALLVVVVVVVWWWWWCGGGKPTHEVGGCDGVPIHGGGGGRDGKPMQSARHRRGAHSLSSSADVFDSCVVVDLVSAAAPYARHAESSDGALSEENCLQMRPPMMTMRSTAAPIETPT